MLQPSETLQTPRLSLRRFTPDDYELFYRIHSDEQVMRNAGGARSREEVQTIWNERVVRYYDQHPGLGIWLTSERATSEPIGVHLLNHLRGEPQVQVGYLLLPAFWGRGYATEMARCVLHYRFTVAKLPEIVAITDLDNFNSQHVLRKVGLERHGERTFAHPMYRARSYTWFIRERAAWLAWHDAEQAARPVTGNG